MSLCLRDTFGNTFYTSRWLHDIVKPSHTIRINIVCKTTTSCIVRDCIGYNRVFIVCPSVGFVHASAQHWLFYQIRDENRAKLKISYSCGHRVSKSARYDATFRLFQKLANNLDIHLSHLMGKPTICICENKDADQLRGNREADQRLCFR